MKARANKLVAITLGLAGAGVCAQTQLSLRLGETADLGPVYWVANCKSLLKKFAGVDVLEGPPNVQLSIREEAVTARRQNCPDKVPGGMVVVTVGAAAAPGPATLKYRVNYDTEDGRRQSSHSAQLELVAPAK